MLQGCFQALKHKFIWGAIAQMILDGRTLLILYYS